MERTIRTFLLIEAAAFAAASLVHTGLVIDGFEHDAYVPEGIIAALLAAGLVATGLWPAGTRGIGLAVQAFALGGTGIGVWVTIVGVGPRTIPDIVFHVAAVVILVAGLVVAGRSRSGVEPGEARVS